jgi:hypothetical protein
MPKKNGFTKLPHGFHKRIVDFKDGKSFARLAVWLAHRCMEGKEGTSYPSLKRLKEYTGLGLGAVKHARRWLRANGWLVSTGQKHAATGRFGVPIEHTAVPSTVDGSKTHGAGASKTHGKGLSTADGSKTTEVVPSICTPEVVPTQAAPVEVLPPDLPEPLVEGTPSSLESVIVHDIYSLFDIHASPDELRFISGTVGEDYDLWQIVLKMAGSKSWSKLINTPENLVFRMGINPKTGKSAFMDAARAALEGRQRHRQQQAVEAKEAGARRFVVDDCAPRPKFHGKRIA